MRAALFGGHDQGIKLVDVEAPIISHPHDVLIRVRACGICGSDLGILDGRHESRPPVILGHECIGEVVAVGDEVKSLEIGRKVVVEPDIYCGECRYCRLGQTSLCDRQVGLGISSNGCLADYVVVPEAFVHRVPETVSWRTAVLIEPLACAMRGFKRIRAESTETAVVYGAGAMGLLWISLLKNSGVKKIMAVDVVQRRLSAAREVGADVLIDAGVEDPVRQVKAETGGLGANVSVEMVGKAETIGNAIQSLSPGGMTVIMGICRQGVTAQFYPHDLVLGERQIVGSGSGSGVFGAAIKEVASGSIRSEIIVTDEVPLDRFDIAFDRSRKGECIKAVVTMD